MAERLQKVLAAAGVASRRHAEDLIRAGRVTVDGTVVTELGTKVDPATQAVAVDGQPIALAEPKRYLMMNKPAGYVTTARDPQGRPTVYDLLSPEQRSVRLFPVGRLDFDSQGLLLMTNDGDLAFQLTHPRHEIDKEYWVEVEESPSESDLDRLRNGIMLDGRQTAPAAIEPMRTPAEFYRPRYGKARAESPPATTWLDVVIHEGRNREVRRMLATLGVEVIRLMRVRIGPLRLGRMPSGRSRDLTSAELGALRRAVEAKPSGRQPPRQEPRARAGTKTSPVPARPRPNSTTPSRPLHRTGQQRREEASGPGLIGGRSAFPAGYRSAYPPARRPLTERGSERMSGRPSGSDFRTIGRSGRFQPDTGSGTRPNSRPSGQSQSNRPAGRGLGPIDRPRASGPTGGQTGRPRRPGPGLGPTTQGPKRPSRPTKRPDRPGRRPQEHE